MKRISDRLSYNATCFPRRKRNDHGPMLITPFSRSIWNQVNEFLVVMNRAVHLFQRKRDTHRDTDSAHRCREKHREKRMHVQECTRTDAGTHTHKCTYTYTSVRANTILSLLISPAFTEETTHSSQ